MKICTDRILILDGGFGTMLQEFAFTEADFRGIRFRGIMAEVKGCNDLLVLTQPEAVKSIHRRYLEAGADIISTDSFNANAISLSEYHLEEYVHEIASTAARLAREAADSFCTADKPRYVAGSVGPTSKSLSIATDVDNPGIREISFDQLEQAYQEQIDGLIEGGVDVILLETAFDTLNIKAGLHALSEVNRRRGTQVPAMVSVTLADISGRMLAGQSIEAMYASLSSYDLLSIGFNCGFGPSQYLPFIERLAAISRFPVSVHPNAGLPNVDGGYDETAQSFAEKAEAFISRRLVNIIGGCCGTTPEHISMLAKAATGQLPRPLPQPDCTTRLSGLDELLVTPDINFINIGERTNVAGSAKFARLIREGNYEEAVSIARNQVDAGAQIIDVCMDDGLIDGPAAMTSFLTLVASEPEISRVPIVVDSSAWPTIEAGLKAVQGRCIVNSISLKEGEQAFLDKAAKIRSYGAAVIVMLFDEEGQAVSYKRKISIARRAYDLLTGSGFPAWDIIFDPNILSVATGIEEHDSYGKAFIDATAWIKANLPHAKVSGGVSNLSFAFRGNNRVREAMHSVFLYHAIKAGMDMGIVNAGMLQIYDQIEPVLLQRVEDVILYRSKDASEKLISYASTVAGAAVSSTVNEDSWRSLALEDRITYALQKGLDTHIAEDSIEGYDRYGSAAEVIDRLLMPAMEHVGRLFGEGKMFLPQVVKSARVMKKSISALEPFMNSDSGSHEAGTIVLATVKGDVHDIGKNIVSVVMSCNGYDVHDLGVMVEPDRIIDEAISCNAVCIALSGLITPSLEEMRKVCELAGKRGLRIPVIIGGATTSDLHTAVRIAPVYEGLVIRCANASENVKILSKLTGSDSAQYAAEVRQYQEKLRADFASQDKPKLRSLEECRRNRRFRPATTELKPQLQTPSIQDLIPLINWKFFTASWGAKGDTGELLADAQKMLDRIVQGEFLSLQGVVEFMQARSSTDDMIVTDHEGREWVLPMLRNQSQDEDNICLADYVPETGSIIGLCSVSCGIGLHKATEEFRAQGDDYSAIMLKLLADRLTEAYAEYIRIHTGGSIYAFGYPSCPDHTLKRTAFDILRTEALTELRLTESYMIDPGESICGIILPEAPYFSVGKIDRVQLSDYASRRGLPAETIALSFPDKILP